MSRDPFNASSILDPMIAQAEAACDRYRQDLERRHPSDTAYPRRRARLASMEMTLERLKAQRARKAAIVSKPDFEGQPLGLAGPPTAARSDP